MGLTPAGGLLLVWVAYKLYRELRSGGDESEHAGKPGRKTFSGAVFAILLADVSMSLDNALAVAGAARDNIKILVAGLVLSVALMAVAAEWRNRLVPFEGVAMPALVIARRTMFDTAVDSVSGRIGAIDVKKIRSSATRGRPRLR